MEDASKIAQTLKAPLYARVYLGTLLTRTSYPVMTLMNVLLVLHALVTVSTQMGHIFVHVEGTKYIMPPSTDVSLQIFVPVIPVNSYVIVVPPLFDVTATQDTSYHLMVLTVLTLMSVSQVMEVVVKCVSTSQGLFNALVIPAILLIEMVKPVVVCSF